jgi:hypothetical protein
VIHLTRCLLFPFLAASFSRRAFSTSILKFNRYKSFKKSMGLMKCMELVLNAWILFIVLARLAMRPLSEVTTPILLWNDPTSLASISSALRLRPGRWCLFYCLEDNSRRAQIHDLQ